MRTSDFDYALPPDLIAQRPASPRDSSRLLIYDRASERIEHRQFQNLPQFLQEGDALVLNETLVLRARVQAKKIPGGGRAELLLLKQVDPLTWEGIVGGQGLAPGREVIIRAELHATIREDLGGSKRLIEFSHPIESILGEIGDMPVPPYITTPLEDPSEYQTTYAKIQGSAAAPTAGLHFTHELLSALEDQGVELLKITLHVGLDTFTPVTAPNPEEHRIHTEWCSLDQHVAGRVNEIKQAGGRIIAVGTTSVRTLETAARLEGSRVVMPYEGATSLYILPGVEFKVVDALLTNFHLPRSTLLMLVSAFAGREQILGVYAEAIAEQYRFYSFGDAMLIL